MVIEKLLSQAKEVFGIERGYIFNAINGTEALLQSQRQLPLYTYMLFQTKARHDHMQLASAAMLGCLLSHMSIWALVQPNETVVVLEEDAWLDEKSINRLKMLSEDLHGIAWDVLLLENGHLNTAGAWKEVGQIAVTCAYSKNESLLNGKYCSWMGTRGYFFTYDGANALLRHARPFVVQVDALMSLLAAFDPHFRLYWTRHSVVHQNYLHLSTVWDGCIKCYMPVSHVHYYFFLSVVIACLLLIWKLVYSKLKCFDIFNP